MSAGDDRLLDLVGAVSDGKRVDWDAEAARAAEEDRLELVRSLQIVARVAAAHRGIDDAAEPPLPPGAVAPGGGATLGQWGHLEILEQVGQGAFGEVFRARDSHLQREVALKLMGPEESEKSTLAALVLTEGRLLARVRHPNVATVYGADRRDGRVGIWMEFIHGKTLSALQREQGPLGAREAILIGVDLCRALTAVHNAGVIHRDVKAQNVMREDGGRIVLTDFGAGKHALGEDGPEPWSVSGTPLYMSPETLLENPASVRSDLYSLGVLLFHLVTRRFPVEGESLAELLDKHGKGETVLLREVRPELPEGFVSAIERALASDPEQRFGSAGQMERALSTALGVENAPSPDGGKGKRKGALWLGVGGAGVALFLAGALVVSGLWQRRSATGGPAVAASGSYTVQAALYRIAAGSTARERIEPGAQLALGDYLNLEFRASAPLHVYVIDEDDDGRAYALFPLPGLDTRNPLAAGQIHVLPGKRHGKGFSWNVDSTGGREHLLVLASPTPLVEFEAEMNALALPEQTSVSIPDAAKMNLRGIGGIRETPAAQADKSAVRVFEMAKRLGSGSEVVKGVWLRQIDLENPR